MLRIIRHAISLLIMAMCAIPVSGCVGSDSIISVSASGFEKEIKTDSVQLLDVRTPREYAEGHIDGAINLNVQSEDFRRMAEKELSKDSTVLVYCRSGRRSLTAAEILAELGYRVINLKGGIMEWKDEGLPVVTTEMSSQATDE